MSLMNLSKFPASYYGGKTDAAPAVWAALGDPHHYIEPFAGSCAVLLLRPHLCNRTYFSETVNDADGLLVNALRSLRDHPDATAKAASVQVAEAELMSRHLALLRFVREHDLECLMADPAWCDPVIGGWWIWGVSAWIGSGFCSGTGPWIVGADGRIAKREKDKPGVFRQRPHLANDGQGVNHAGTREPGVFRQRPQLADDGRGVNHAGAREPGVAPGTPDHPWEAEDFHPMTMPEVRRWFAFLSARLRHVRILNGDWQRTVTTGASHTLSVRQGKGVAGYFLDPPYSHAERDTGLYTHDDAGLPAAVRAWCLANGDDPKNRIVLAGFAGEGHEELEAYGWKAVEWFKAGFLKGGMGNQSDANADGVRHQQARERLWCSPNCLQAAPDPDLFDGYY